MAHESSIRRYRNWYAKLLQFYPKSYRGRFAAEMEQTFSDLLRECAGDGKIFCRALWMFSETSVAIIKDRMSSSIVRSKNLVRIGIGTALLLLIPFLAGAPWALGDYVIMGALLFGTGLAYELIARNSRPVVYRLATGIAVVTALLLVWVNLAVGIIGSENNPANLMYHGVLVVGILGAILARLEPRGMARTLLAMAAAQALVPVIALVIWRPPITFGLVQVFAGNALFVMMFLASALLFRRAVTKPV